MEVPSPSSSNPRFNPGLACPDCAFVQSLYSTTELTNRQVRATRGSLPISPTTSRKASPPGGDPLPHPVEAVAVDTVRLVREDMPPQRVNPLRDGFPQSAGQCASAQEFQTLQGQQDGQTPLRVGEVQAGQSLQVHASSVIISGRLRSYNQVTVLWDLR